MELIYYRHNSHKPMGALKKRCLTYFDATFLLQGEMDYIVDGREYHLGKEDMILIPSGSYRERAPFEGCNYISFNFRPRQVPELPLVIRGAITSAVRMLLLACCEICAKTNDNDRRLTLVLESILLQLKNDLLARDTSPLVRSIKAFIAAHVGEPIDRKAVAEHTFFSVSHCAAVFKHETGTSLTDYILEEKIRRAKELLCEGSSLSDTSAAVGFSDYNYFSRAFKKRTGTSPLRYRQLIFGKS